MIHRNFKYQMPPTLPEGGEPGDQMPSLTRPPPIFRLPFDLLHTIILLVYKSHWDWDKNEFVAIVSLVCRSWRIVANESPALWSRIMFTRPPPFNRQRVQIERSKRAPLTIEIHRNYGIKQTVQLIKLLRPHVTRWASLAMPSYEFKAKSYRLFFDELRHESAPMLKKLEVVNYNSENHGWTFQPFSGGAPRLSELKISSCRLKGNTALFGNLTELTIMHDDSGTIGCSLSTRDIFAILTRTASTITYVYINAPQCKVAERTNPSAPRITLPHLQYMTLSAAQYPSYLPPAWVHEVYSGIVAPGVRDYTFHPSTLQHLATHNVFPFPGLKSLGIEASSGYGAPQIEIPQSTFRRVLADLPQLEGLKVINLPCFDHRLLASLCDELKWLSLRLPEWPIDRVERSGIQETIEARRLRSAARGMTDTLESVSLETFKLPEEEVTWLKSHLRKFKYSLRW